MLNIVFIIFGSMMIGYGTHNLAVGIGIGVIALGFHVSFITYMQSMHENIIRNLGKIYQKIN